jgi:YaiO family outer membrane protein
MAHSLEVSLGGRYLGFKDNPVYILTGQAGISIGSSWLALRPFFVKGEKGNSVTTVLTYKYYTGKPRSFWKVDVSYGNSPDERYYIGTNAERLRMQGYSIKFEKNIIIGRLNEITPSAGFGSEEITSGGYRSKIMLEIQYKKRF